MAKRKLQVLKGDVSKNKLTHTLQSSAFPGVICFLGKQSKTGP